MFVVLFIVAAIGIPFLSPRVTKDPKLKQSLIAVVLCHQVISLLQVALDGLPTMRGDPLRFNSTAMTGVGADFDHYALFLRWIYEVVGGSHLLGCEVSQIWFGIALIVEIEILYALGLAKHAPKLILIFGFLPSCLLNTSVTLREAAQMVFFLSFVLLLLKIGKEGPSLFSLMLIPVCVILTFLHQGFAAALVLLLPLGLAWSVKARPLIMSVLVLGGLSGGYIVKDRIVASLAANSKAFDSISSGDLEYVEIYATKVNDSRTNFGVTLDLSSPIALLKTGPLLFAYYLFSPFPWQVRSLLDLYGMGECILRIILLLLGIQAIRLSKGQLRHDLILLFLLFLGMEAVWAAGTANWGTAFRHRLVAWGLLVALGGAGWNMRTKNIVEPDPSTPQEPTKKWNKGSIRSRRRALRDRQQGIRDPADRPIRTARRGIKRRDVP